MNCGLKPWNEALEWSHVLLIDIRKNVAEDFDEAALRLMAKINELPSHPPMVVLCDDEQRGPFLRAVEYGADDSITNPPNISEVRLVLRRAHKLYVSEQEIRKLRGAESAGKLHELVGTSAGNAGIVCHGAKDCDLRRQRTGHGRNRDRQRIAGARRFII